MDIKRKRSLSVIAFVLTLTLVFTTIPILGGGDYVSAESEYNESDVNAIKKIINDLGLNGLDVSDDESMFIDKDDIDTWDFVTWDYNETDRRVDRISFSKYYQSVTGELNLTELSELRSIWLVNSSISEIDITGLSNTPTINIGTAPLTKITDVRGITTTINLYGNGSAAFIRYTMKKSFFSGPSFAICTLGMNPTIYKWEATPELTNSDAYQNEQNGLYANLEADLPEEDTVISLFFKDSIDKATATIADQAYNGNALTPEPDVKYYGFDLVKDEDYEITSYENNKEGGTASVVITGLGRFANTTKTINFNIKKEEVVNKETVQQPENAAVPDNSATPATKESVLGEEAPADDEADDQAVLGEEAKTSDSINLAIMISIIMLALGVMIATIRRRLTE